MPNTGKPSKDCHLCRSRRVKCDLGRPACQRCIKYGAECPGYRDQQELVFRNSNPTSVKKRKKRSQQASREASEASTSDSSPSTTQVSTPATSFYGDSETSLVIAGARHVIAEAGLEAPLELSPTIHEHWTAHSVPIILNIYSSLDFLHNLYRENSHSGPLVWAAHLFSRTYVTNLRHSTARYKDSVAETDRELGTYLGKTLSAVSAALKTPEGALRDDVLATVWILANYELLVGSIDRMEPLSPWHLHARGLYSILKSRGTQSLRTETGRQCFWSAYNMVQVQCLLSNTECPPESEEWLRVIQEEQGPESLEMLGINVCHFVIKVAHVQARVITIMRGRDFSAASVEYKRLVGTMSEAYNTMDAYLATRTGLEDFSFQPYMRNMYYSACVKGFHILMLFANFLTHHVASQIPLEELQALRMSCVSVVRSSAKTIMASLPNHLDPAVFSKDKSPKRLFDALKLIWPLTAVYVMPSTDPEDRLEAETALRFIGRELGVRQALKVYPGGTSLPEEALRPLKIVEIDGMTDLPFPP